MKVTISSADGTYVPVLFQSDFHTYQRQYYVKSDSKGEDTIVEEEINYTIGDFRNANQRIESQPASHVEKKFLHGVQVEEESLNTPQYNIESYKPCTHVKVEGSIEYRGAVDPSLFDGWFYPDQYGYGEKITIDVETDHTSEVIGGPHWRYPDLTEWSADKVHAFRPNAYTLVVMYSRTGGYVHLESRWTDPQFCSYQVQVFHMGTIGGYDATSAFPFPDYRTLNRDDVFDRFCENFESITESYYSQPEHQFATEADHTQPNTIYNYGSRQAGVVPDVHAIFDMYRAYATKPYVEAIAESLGTGAVQNAASPAFLVATAAASADNPFEGNGIAYALDAIKLRQSLNAFKQECYAVARKYKDKIPVGKFKALAGMYLGWHYGARLTYQDSKELWKALKERRDDSIKHAKADASFAHNFRGVCNFDVVTRYTIVYYCDPNESALSQFVREYDLALNLGNGWDLIPFSFVADWFASIGDALDAVDKYLTMERSFKVVCGIYTLKGQSEPLPLPEGFSGEAHISFFGREIEANLPEPAFYVESKVPGLKHLVEAGALTLVMAN